MSTISLPSLETMFPEHLFRVPPELRVKGSEPPRLIPSFASSANRKHKASSSFHVLRSDTSSSSVSLKHVPQPGPSVLRRHSPQHTSDSVTASSEGEGDDSLENTGISSSRRHICELCGKRFNRPSSLKIHQNTHTGAKPFPCPFPGCGRVFNVNSNMRRHHKSHIDTGRARVAPSVSPTSASVLESNTGSHQRINQAERQRPSELEESSD
ncbi:hypothetical protein IW262DRAFT_1420936 [Armillaria fumosa]|nr:hypothetical protein IW262DRAFT_1420936 [Armillaria fumosa]